MTVNEAYQQVLTKLQQLNAQITLKLPANLLSVRRQLQQLRNIQQQLEVLQNEMRLTIGMGGSPSAYWKYCFLSEQIHQMRQNARTLEILAEEYPVDPEGATACLKSFYHESFYQMSIISGSSSFW